MTRSAARGAANARWRWVRRIGYAGLGLSVAAAIWGFGIEPGLLATHPVELTVSPGTLPAEPLRIAVLTDLHVGAPHIDLEQLTAVVDASNAAAPDLVVILGDLVIHGVVGGDFVEPEPIARELGRLHARLGVYAVLGNHDWWYDGSRVASALRDAEIVVLQDAAHRTDDGVWLAGITDYWTRPHDVEAALRDIPPGAPTIAITHNPDVFPDIPDSVALTIAGHTHGGQVCVPLWGPPVVPSKYGQRYAEGHVVEQGRHLFVGAGVGTSILPVRFLVRPRVDLLTVHGG